MAIVLRGLRLRLLLHEERLIHLLLLLLLPIKVGHMRRHRSARGGVAGAGIRTGGRRDRGRRGHLLLETHLQLQLDLLLLLLLLLLE